VWRYQAFGGVVLLLLVPLLLLRWKRFSAGSPALDNSAVADLRDDSWILASGHPPPHVLGAVLSVLLHRGWDLLNLGAGRGLPSPTPDFHRCKLRQHGDSAA
jgi:hypothetical protein